MSKPLHREVTALWDLPRCAELACCAPDRNLRVGGLKLVKFPRAAADYAAHPSARQVFWRFVPWAASKQVGREFWSPAHLPSLRTCFLIEHGYWPVPLVAW